MVSSPLFLVLAIALTLAVSTMVLWPLRRQRALMIAAIACVLAATGALYQWLGTPAALQAQPVVAHTPGQPGSLDEAIAALEAELRANPNEPEGWRLLGRSYASLQRYAEAQQAYQRAVQLLPDDPNLLVEAVQVRLFNNPERLIDDAGRRMLDHALQLSPRNQRGLWFLGIAQRQQGQAAEAVKTWESLLPEVEPGTARLLREQIAETQRDAGLPMTEAADSAPPPVAAAPTTGLRITVELDPALQARLQPGSQLFVFARQPDGPPMPVAAKRMPASGFPVQITLSDDDSPMPTMKLSQLPRVQLVARISHAGQAVAQAGDLQANAMLVETTSRDVHVLRIDQVVE